MTQPRDPNTEKWIDRLFTALPPLTLIVALMVYFAWVRRIAQARELGIDPSALEEASTPGYLMRSVAALYLPITAGTVFAIAVLFGHRFVLSRALGPSTRPWTRRLIWLVPATGLVVVLIALFIRLFGPTARAYVDLMMPFLLALAILMISYGLVLRGKLQVRGRRRSGVPASRGFAAPALTGLLIAALLFNGVDGFAQVVGRGLARQMIDNPAHYTQAIVLFSRYDLQLSPSDAQCTGLSPGDENGYRYRCIGLRLAFVDGGTYYLVPGNWQASGKMIVLEPQDLRVEFVP